MNGSERHALKRLLEQAAKQFGQSVSACVGGWKFVLTCGLFGQDSMDLIARRYPIGRPTKESDQHFLDEARTLFGASDDSLLAPVEAADPDGVYHWQLGTSEEIRATTRAMLAAARARSIG